MFYQYPSDCSVPGNPPDIPVSALEAHVPVPYEMGDQIENEPSMGPDEDSPPLVGGSSDSPPLIQLKNAQLLQVPI